MVAENPHVGRFLTTGAPDPLATIDDGTHATISVSGEITVLGCQHGWRLVADARWHERRLDRTPWAVAAVTTADELLAINLAAVDIAALPAGIGRALELQALQFCSTPQKRWRETIRTSAGFTHDSYFLVGGHKTPVKRPVSTPEDVFAIQREKTFHYLSEKPRRIAQLLDVNDGLTLEELIEHFNPEAAQRRAVKNSLHTELVRMRKHPKINLCRTPDGRYTIAQKTPEMAPKMAEKPAENTPARLLG